MILHTDTYTCAYMYRHIHIYRYMYMCVLISHAKVIPLAFSQVDIRGKRFCISIRMKFIILHYLLRRNSDCWIVYSVLTNHSLFGLDAKVLSCIRWLLPRQVKYPCWSLHLSIDIRRAKSVAKSHFFFYSSIFMKVGRSEVLWGIKGDKS